MESNKRQTDESAESSYEKSDVAIGKIIAFGFAGVIIIVALVLLLMDYYNAYTEDVVSDVVLKPKSTELRELRAHETEVLNSYKLLDDSLKIYQIPIERAMKLMADEAYQNKK